MRSHLSTVVELVGYGCVVAAVWMFDARFGVLALGAALIVAAYGAGGKR